MADKSVEKLFAEILKDYKEVTFEAMKKAAIRAQTDIIDQAHSYLEQYYKNYTPKWYRRKKNLQRAIVPVYKFNKTRRRFNFTIGVEYDDSKLDGLYKSNSPFHQSGNVWRSSGFPIVGFGPEYKQAIKFDPERSDNGVPESDWILDNYLVGIHPWGKQDRKKTTFQMEYFIRKQIPKRINGYVREELFDIVVNRLQKG